MTHQEEAQNYYDLLQVKPTASPQDVRRAYRDLSKLYHPDTTQLSPEVATEKFQTLNEAYATLSNPEKRLAYDYSIGISRVAVIQTPAYLNRPASERGRYQNSSAYLDPTDRPLSPGELFALFILGVTFVGCLVLVFAISWSNGEIILKPTRAETTPVPEVSDATSPTPEAIPETDSVLSPAIPKAPTLAPESNPVDSSTEPVERSSESPASSPTNSPVPKSISVEPSSKSPVIPQAALQAPNSEVGDSSQASSTSSKTSTTSSESGSIEPSFEPPNIPN